MKITIAKSAGFCPGVSNAVKVAYDNADKDTSMLGELIHNSLVVDDFVNKGVKIVDDVARVDTKRVIIRSHGERKEYLETLRNNGVEIIDTTCPFVNKLHDIIKHYYSEGYNILIAGKKDHQEIIAANSECDYTAIVFDSADSMPTLDNNKKYVLVFQTTFDIVEFDKICKKIQKQYAKIVVIFNTICYTTKVRQEEAVELAKNNDIMLVLGSDKSSNTIKLYENCKRWCNRTYLIRNVADLKLVKKNIFDSLAITAGASTPKELIMEVTNIMSEVLEKTNSSDMTMEDVMKGLFNEKQPNLHVGRRVKCTVFKADEKGITVSVNAKKEGFIPAEEATLDGNYNPADFNNGDEIEAIVIENTTNDKTYLPLSKKAVDEILVGDEKAKEILAGNEFKMVCDRVAFDEKKNAKGLIGKVGTYTVFVPASHVRSGFVKDLTTYVGKELRLRALPPKDGEEKKTNAKRIVASQRVILEEEKKAKEDNFWNSLEEGKVVNGKVKRFTDFGAFVSVNGFDCLARKADLAWFRIEKPEEVLKLNEKYDFVVLSINREDGKVALGYKQLQPTPYEAAAQKYVVGDVIMGNVVRIYPFGAFISIEPGVDGLVHISQVSHNYIKDLNEVLKVGDQVEAKIINIDNKRITLSIKDLLPLPEVTEEVAAEAEEVAGDKPAKKTSKRKFDVDSADLAKAPKERKKASKEKKTDDDEAHEWRSDNNATLGDLFKGIDFGESNK